MAQSKQSKSLLDIRQLENLANARIGIVYTEWNDKIVRELVNGCQSMVHRFDGNILDGIIVPGAFELPFGCRTLWQRFEKTPEKPEAIIAFGAVIKGGTPHFDYVCKAVTDGILQLNLTLPIPIIFGVLTLDSEEQAWERLGGSHGHKGEEAAITALKMIRMCRVKN